jgi:hypothetical protein
MLDPTPVHPEQDYRSFGHMFFDRAKDPLEIDNGIDDEEYQTIISTLKGYFREFEQETPATGKEELVRQYTKR